jgi:uncharacterized protein (TIGR03066 family)
VVKVDFLPVPGGWRRRTVRAAASPRAPARGLQDCGGTFFRHPRFFSMKGTSMKLLATVIACCVVLALAGPSRADTKDAPKTNKEKIVGVWELSKSEDKNAPVGATVEFTKDGKMIVKFKMEDKAVTIEGTYTIEKDSITSVLKHDDQEMKETVTIKKLTDKELVVVDGKGKTDEFKKK